LRRRFHQALISKRAGTSAYADQHCKPPARTPVVDGSLLSCPTFNAAAERSRISTEAFSAAQAEIADTTRGTMGIVGGMETVAGMPTEVKMEIVAGMETVTGTEIGRTTADHEVRISRAARMSAPTATRSRPVARRKTASGDRRHSETTTGATETSSTITEGSSAPGESVIVKAGGVSIGQKRGLKKMLPPTVGRLIIVARLLQ